jgi:glycosyltransferase involved in cell wall biosynthesis
LSFLGALTLRPNPKILENVSLALLGVHPKDSLNLEQQESIEAVKITFVIPQDSLAGGIRVVSIYAAQFQKQGHEVKVVTAPLPQPSLRQRLKALLQLVKEPRNASVEHRSYFTDANIPVHTLAQGGPLTDHDLPDADVVIATWWETAEWIAPLSAAKGVKVYFIQHYEVFDYLPKHRVEATYRLPFYQITVAKWIVEILRDRYAPNVSSPVQQISLVSNGVDLQQFCSPPRPKASVPTVGLIYTATPWKGVDIALQAFQYALQALPNLRLVAFGMEPPVAHLPLPNNAQYFFQPAQDCIKDIYAQCDVWLFSSHTEGFGLPILEAMACRTPVIAAPAGAAPELLCEGGGIVLERNDPVLMAQAIQKICTLEDTQWQQLSEQAYQTACQNSWEKATHDFEAALVRAIAANSVA